jgi:dipeptidyl aminopeptidase/acylaminoacyl peptidase
MTRVAAFGRWPSPLSADAAATSRRRRLVVRVTDLVALSAATHDFESRYNDRLIGPFPGAAAEYDRRSPVHQVAQMAGAVLLLQGLDDPVVPPAQATAMVAALEAEVAFYREVLSPEDPDQARVGW